MIEIKMVEPIQVSIITPGAAITVRPDRVREVVRNTFNSLMRLDLHRLVPSPKEEP